MFLGRDLTDAVCDILIAEFLYDFLRTGNDKIRNAGKFCNLDTITLVSPAFYALSSEYDVIALFFYSNTIVVDIINLSFEFCQFMIMCGE